MQNRWHGVVWILACILALSGCSESKPDRSSSMSNSTNDPGADSPRHPAAKTDGAEAKHPSPDIDGMVWYFGSSQGAQSREKQETYMLVYTDGYLEQATALAKERHIRLKKQVSDDVMGAIVDQMQQFQFFSWPASPDYSAMKTPPLASVGQINVETAARRHMTAWTSDDTKRMTSADASRQQHFLDLKMVILAFCQESDMEITTQVQSR